MNLLENLQTIAELADVPTTAVRPAVKTFVFGPIVEGGIETQSVSLNMSEAACFAICDMHLRVCAVDESTAPDTLLVEETNDYTYSELITVRIIESSATTVIPATSYSVLRSGIFFVVRGASEFIAEVSVGDFDDLLGGMSLRPALTLRGFVLPMAGYDRLSQFNFVRL